MWALCVPAAQVWALMTDLAPRPGVWGVAHPATERVGQPCLMGGGLEEAPRCPRDPKDGDRSLGTVLSWGFSSSEPCSRLPLCRPGCRQGARTFCRRAPTRPVKSEGSDCGLLSGGGVTRLLPAEAALTGHAVGAY